MNGYDKLMNLCEILGTDTVISELYNYFGDWDIEKAVDSIGNDYDINSEEDEEE